MRWMSCPVSQAGLPWLGWPFEFCSRHEREYERYAEGLGAFMSVPVSVQDVVATVERLLAASDDVSGWGAPLPAVFDR